MIDNRYDFIMLFDVENGNPNGDPDNDNSPRIDPETNIGLITDVCLKRKIRNYITLLNNPKYEILIQERAIINNLLDPVVKEAKKDKKDANDLICAKYYDVRCFGGVISTGENKNGKSVKGPVQISFAKSIDPISVHRHCITRCAVTTDKESKEQGGLNQTMGNKWTIPYALYKCSGHVNAPLSKLTGFNDDDLKLFWNAAWNMFELDRSSSRGFMSMKKIIIWKHNSLLGNCHADKLFDKVKINKYIEFPRSFNDYEIIINNDLPDNVTCVELK